MIRIYLALVDLIPAATVLIPVFLLLHTGTMQRNSRKTVWYCLFCLYMSAVFSLVGIPNVTYSRPGLNVNLIPFLGILRDLKNSLWNIFLFVPLGLFLPALWERYRNLTSSVFAGFALSLFIELLQTLTYRATDVNDLITNVTGTVIGFLLAKTFFDRIPTVGQGNGDVYQLCALSFFVMFFAHPFLSPLIWDKNL